MQVLDRRQFCAAGAAFGLGATGVANLGMANATSGSAASFKVFRNGSEIGYHTVTVSQDEDRTVADIEIFLEVGIGPIVLYRFQHKNREIWEGGQFVSFSSETDNDGDPYRITATRRQDGIFVSRDHDEDFLIEGFDAIPTTYWNADTIRTRRMIDTQKGRLMEFDVLQGGWQMVGVQDGSVEAQKFDIAGDLNMTLWYDRTGAWTKLSFPFKGDSFDYLKTS